MTEVGETVAAAPAPTITPAPPAVTTEAAAEEPKAPSPRLKENTGQAWRTLKFALLTQVRIAGIAKGAAARRQSCGLLRRESTSPAASPGCKPLDGHAAAAALATQQAKERDEKAAATAQATEDEEAARLDRERRLKQEAEEKQARADAAVTAALVALAAAAADEMQAEEARRAAEAAADAAAAAARHAAVVEAELVDATVDSEGNDSSGRRTSSEGEREGGADTRETVSTLLSNSVFAISSEGDFGDTARMDDENERTRLSNDASARRRSTPTGEWRPLPWSPGRKGLPRRASVPGLDVPLGGRQCHACSSPQEGRSPRPASGSQASLTQSPKRRQSLGQAVFALSARDVSWSPGGRDREMLARSQADVAPMSARRPSSPAGDGRLPWSPGRKNLPRRAGDPHPTHEEDSPRVSVSPRPRRKSAAPELRAESRACTRSASARRTGSTGRRAASTGRAKRQTSSSRRGAPRKASPVPASSASNSPRDQGGNGFFRPSARSFRNSMYARDESPPPGASGAQTPPPMPTESAFGRSSTHSPSNGRFPWSPGRKEHPRYGPLEAARSASPGPGNSPRGDSSFQSPPRKTSVASPRIAPSKSQSRSSIPRHASQRGVKIA